MAEKVGKKPDIRAAGVFISRLINFEKRRDIPDERKTQSDQKTSDYRHFVSGARGAACGVRTFHRHSYDRPDCRTGRHVPIGACDVCRNAHLLHSVFDPDESMVFTGIQRRHEIRSVREGYVFSMPSVYRLRRGFFDHSAHSVQLLFFSHPEGCADGADRRIQ